MSSTRHPLVSVLIPTCGRPQYLPRAVDSALAHAGDNVEVIVVPNGSDQSWRDSLSRYANDARVNVSPIKEAHGNAARNHGMTLAQGKYLRFLDDDDYLLPAARAQVNDLECTGFDIGVGRIDIITRDGVTTAARMPVNTTNFVDSIITSGHLSLLHAYLYRRKAITAFTWDPHAALAQDKLWLYKLCREKEWKLAQTDRVVGVWRQHHDTRVSGNKRLQIQSEIWAGMLWDTVCRLDAQQRLDASRKVAACQHLWKLVCEAYYLHPQHWDGVIKNIIRMSPETKPDLFLWRYPATRWVDPRTVLRATVPLMHVTRWIRIALFRLKLYHPTIRP